MNGGNTPPPSALADRASMLSPAQSLAGKVLRVFLGVVLAVVCIEAVVRLSEWKARHTQRVEWGRVQPPIWEPSERYWVRLRPNINSFWASRPPRGTRRDVFFAEVTTNSFGQHDTETTLAKPPGVYRVLLLGDSFTEAVYVGLEHAYPTLLEKNLTAQLGRPIEVINTGVRSWGPTMEFLYYRYEGRKFEPDLVVLLFTYDDLADELRNIGTDQIVEYDADGLPLDGHFISEGEGAPLFGMFADSPEHAGVQSRAWALLLQKGMGLRRRWRVMRHEDFAPFWRTCDPVADPLFIYRSGCDDMKTVRYTRLFTILTGLQRLVEADGASLAIGVVPVPASFEEEWRRGRTLFHLEELYMHPNLILDPYTRLAAFGATRDVPVFNLYPAFQAAYEAGERPLFFTWDGHPTVQGNRVLARSMGAHLRPLVAEAIASQN